MRRLLIWVIRKYQSIPFNSHYSCKYFPTCSNYAIIAISEYGSVKGTYMSLKRIIRCNPFSKGGFDPVPLKKEKK